MGSVNVEPTIYQYIPTELIILSPHVEIEDVKQNELNNLRDFTQKQNEVIQQLINKQDSLEEIIKKQNDLLLQITDRMKK